MSLFSTTSEARASNGSRKEKGRDRNAEKLVRRDFASDRRVAAASSSINCVRPCMSPFRAQPTGGLRPNDGITVGMGGQMLLRRPKAAKNRPLPACGLRSSRKQELSVPVRRSSDGFRLTCYEAAGHMLISAALEEHMCTSLNQLMRIALLLT